MQNDINILEKLKILNENANCIFNELCIYNNSIDNLNMKLNEFVLISDRFKICSDAYKSILNEIKINN